jgi:hypothetical protein
MKYYWVRKYYKIQYFINKHDKIIYYCIKLKIEKKQYITRPIVFDLSVTNAKKVTVTVLYCSHGDTFTHIFKHFLTFSKHKMSLKKEQREQPEEHMTRLDDMKRERKLLCGGDDDDDNNEWEYLDYEEKQQQEREEREEQQQEWEELLKQQQRDWEEQQPQREREERRQQEWEEHQWQERLDWGNAWYKVQNQRERDEQREREKDQQARELGEKFPYGHRDPDAQQRQEYWNAVNRMMQQQIKARETQETEWMILDRERPEKNSGGKAESKE